VQDDFQLLLDLSSEPSSPLHASHAAPSSPALQPPGSSSTPGEHALHRQLSNWASITDAWVELEPDDFETLHELRAAMHESHASHVLAVHQQRDDAQDACCSIESLAAPLSLDELSDDTLVCMTLD
jgi:hypothetical protein